MLKPTKDQILQALDEREEGLTLTADQHLWVTEHDRLEELNHEAAKATATRAKSLAQQSQHQADLDEWDEIYSMSLIHGIHSHTLMAYATSLYLKVGWKVNPLWPEIYNQKFPPTKKRKRKKSKAQKERRRLAAIDRLDAGASVRTPSVSASPTATPLQHNGALGENCGLVESNASESKNSSDSG